MEHTNDLEQDLNTLIQEHGLIAFLEALKQVIEIKTEVLLSSPSESTASESNSSGSNSSEANDEQAETLQAVSRLLTELIATVPPELEVELALAQVLHPSGELEPDADKLASGLE